MNSDAPPPHAASCSDGKQTPAGMGKFPLLRRADARARWLASPLN